MTLVNPLRHPQTLFLGFRDDDPRLTAMQEIVGEWRVIGASGFEELRAGDWDLLIAESVDLDDVRVPGHIYIIAFDCEALGDTSGRKRAVGASDGDGTRSQMAVYYQEDQYSLQLRVTTESPTAVRRLIESESVPALKSRTPMPHLNIRSNMSWGFSANHCIPFLEDADKNVVVGEFSRSQSNALCWSIPYVSHHPEQWLLAALNEWHSRKPDIFPEVAPWRENPNWMTAEELAITVAQEKLREEWHASEEIFAARELDLISRAVSSRTQADAGLRRLLTGQGEPLVEVVSEALNALGFQVIDRDRQREAENLGKVEDLQVVDPSRGDLSIIAEVKGYLKRGASQKDIQQLTEHAVAFAARTGGVPDRRWYIVNQFAQEPPDARPAPLGSAKEHREIFAQAGGLVVDTRDLFQIARDVASGDLKPEAARALLVDSTDVLEYPAEEA